MTVYNLLFDPKLSIVLSRPPYTTFFLNFETTPTTVKTWHQFCSLFTFLKPMLFTYCIKQCMVCLALILCGFLEKTFQ